MKIYNQVLLILLFFANSVHAEFDTASALGGAAVSAVTAVLCAVYKKYTDQTDYQRRIHELNETIASYKIQYKNERDVAKLNNIDQRISEISALLMHANISRENLAQKLDRDLAVLQKELVFSQMITDNQMKESTQKDIRVLIHDLRATHDLLKKDAPFIELELIRHNKQERWRLYEAASNAGTLFNGVPCPHVTAVEHMNRDAEKLMHYVKQAENQCRQNACTSSQENLITKGKQYIADIEWKRSTVLQSNEYSKELHHFELVKAEEKKTMAALAQAECRKQENAIKLNEQSIKEKQLLQNEKQLALNELTIKEGRLFEREKNAYESKIQLHQMENKDLQRQLNQCNESTKQFVEQIKQCEQTFNANKEDVDQLNQLLNNPPFNPDSEEGFAEFWKKVKATARKIANRCMRPQQS